MEAQEELATKQSSTTTTMMMMKGKRTKRPRASPVISHPTHRVTLASTSSAENGVVSATSSSENTHAVSSASTTEEEEDMAHCLILLARGRHDHHDRDRPRNDVVYQCKTCDRIFPSFQALGGHRASHKKPKASTGETTPFDEGLFATSTALSLQVSPSRGSLVIKGNPSTNGNNGHNSNTVKAPKVHECSICGAEFTSGQALGGHMRRHRTASFVNPTGPSPNSPDSLQESAKKPGSESGSGSGSRNVLELDLNLPAPEERPTKFPFGKEQVIVFSASPLVDCHY